MNFLVMPVFFLSGALFPLNGLPKALRIVTRFNPLTYGVDGLRGALIQTAHFTLWYDFFILGMVACFFVGVGAYLFSKIQI